MDHLCASEGFHEQGDLASAMRTDVPTILANTDSFGGHVCTWVRISKAGYMVRTKAYNKVISNCEAGDPIGGHLADYVDCPNHHLRRTFLHPDVQPRGCTRIEVSLGRPLCEHGQRGGGGGLGPGFPFRSARPVCSPTTRQAVGEHGRVPRPVYCPSRPAAGLDIRRLVCTHDNRSGLRGLGPAHQGKHRQIRNHGRWS